MKRLLACAVAALGLIGTPALAADMALKAPPPPAAVPVYNWTGFYVGGFISGAGTIRIYFEDSDHRLARSLACTTARSTPLVSSEADKLATITRPAGLYGGSKATSQERESPALPAWETVTRNFLPHPSSLQQQDQLVGNSDGSRRRGLQQRSFYIIGGGAWARENLQNPCTDCGEGDVANNSVFSGWRDG